MKNFAYRLHIENSVNRIKLKMTVLTVLYLL